MRIKYKQRQLHIKWFSIAWHWNWSITWRWIFSIKRHYSGHKLGFRSITGNQNWLVVWNTLWLDFSFQTQPNIARRPEHSNCRCAVVSRSINGN